MNSVVKGRDLKVPKFRAAASGISRRGGWDVLIHLGRLVGCVLEFCM